MTTFWIWHDYSTTLWISNFCFQISDHVRSNKKESKIINLKSQILQLLPARITVRVCTLATARIPINPASRAQTFAILATQNLSRHRQQNLLTNQVVEEILLAMPGQILCREDCKGLCPTCGIDRNAGSCQCADSDGDSRWEQLKNLRF